MSERGFLLSGAALYAAIGAGIIIIVLGGLLKIQTSRLETCRVEFGAFKLETKRLGEAQDKKNREREAADTKLKEKTDADHKAAVARLNRDIKRLRDASARRSLVPEAPAASRRPDLACFDRPIFAGALRAFEEGLVGLIGEGTENTLNLDAAKRWAQAISQ